MKLLWAPIVDSLYSAKFGRRKTWIAPAQALIGVLLLYSGSRIDALLGDNPEGAVDVTGLTSLFLVFFFLAATQDIAVDGLALTILSERNRELGATCNAIGASSQYSSLPWLSTFSDKEGGTGQDAPVTLQVVPSYLFRAERMVQLLGEGYSTELRVYTGFMPDMVATRVRV